MADWSIKIQQAGAQAEFVPQLPTSQPTVVATGSVISTRKALPDSPGSSGNTSNGANARV